MNKGTHSKTINGVKYVWKVEDLWRHAEGLAVQEIDPKTAIDLERDGWFGGRAPSAGEVLEHMKRILAADLNYPVILDQDGSIMDGAHRVCRAILENRRTIKVVKFTETPVTSSVEESSPL